jgi:hypothetical protein
MRYRCPVCFFDKLPYPPADYHICPCCGTEFDNDDAEFSHRQLREMWVAGGANWFFGRAPEHWNPWLQLLRADRSLAAHFPVPILGVYFRASESYNALEPKNFTGSIFAATAA